jgi:hypothetical protein
MAWKKFFKTANVSSNLSPLGNGSTRMPEPGYRNYQSTLPEVYVGHPNRIERYNQYEAMDQDSEVNAALDILAEFCSQDNSENHTPFEIRYKDKPTDHEVNIIKEQLQQWVALNEFNKRMFKIVRNTLKYGDQVFIRDPQTFKMMWTEMGNVTKVIVNEADGKKPEQYMIKDINPNFQNLTVTAVSTSDSYSNSPQVGGGNGGYISPNTAQSGGSRFSHQHNEAVINAEHIVHMSLTEGLDAYWPFGTSVLEHVFKVFKQKELLEDSIIIYRVQRAPERRIFKIDVGNMPPHMAMAFVDRIKNEIAQRRIPTQSGGGANMMDATYNPLSTNEDFFFPVTADGRGSSVEALPGGCLAMDTRVPLLDGRTLTLTEMSDEYQNGKQNWVYSCDPKSGQVVPGKVSWAGVTQQSARVMKLTLDNGESIIVTPDHKFPIIGRGTLRADELVVSDSLIPHNIKNEVISKFAKRQYTQVYQNHSKKWEFVHRVVRDNLPLDKFTFGIDSEHHDHDVVHHVDHDRFNNSPENLVLMDWENHQEYHAFNGFSAEVQQLGTLAASHRLSEMQLHAPSEYEKCIKEYSKRALAMWASMAETEKTQHISKLTEGLHDYYNKHFGNQEIKYDKIAMDMIQSHVMAAKHVTIDLIASEMSMDPKFLGHLQSINVDTNSKKWKGLHFNSSMLVACIKRNGYSSWGHFKKDVLEYNHKIVCIEYLDTKIQVGTLTIDQHEEHHDFHNFALSSGVFTQNSNLGEITDLRFFTNKLFRGLRIPSSYLPTGADEGSATFNDGKVGTALIQEKRFNEYCIRLQKMIVDKMDQEFKMFMRWRGVNIDSALFDVVLMEPQNFAHYAQADVDSARIATFTQLEAYPYFSKRWLMKRYLGLSEQEMNENQQQWAEEQGDVEAAPPGQTDLRSVGITPGGLSSDLENVSPDLAGDAGMAGGTAEAPGAPAAGAGANVPAPAA